MKIYKNLRKWSTKIGHSIKNQCTRQNSNLGWISHFFLFRTIIHLITVQRRLPFVFFGGGERDMKSMTWPGNCPDLNLIENLRKFLNHGSWEDSSHQRRSSWNPFDKEYCFKLVKSMQKKNRALSTKEDL